MIEALPEQYFLGKDDRKANFNIFSFFPFLKSLGGLCPLAPPPYDAAPDSEKLHKHTRPRSKCSMNSYVKLKILFLLETYTTMIVLSVPILGLLSDSNVATLLTYKIEN